MSELHEAAYSGNIAAIKECLRTGFNVNEGDLEWGNKTPLHIASSGGHAGCVTLLLESGAKVDAVTDSGWTPAHFACETGQSECLEILLTFGADANTPDQCGDTPVHIAKLYDQKYCISIIKNFQVKEEEEEEEEEEQEETPE